jgi:glycosyltransferase involved in cell wall biosynthesis
LRILVVNWQDRENPQAGGAEIHLHEIFGRLASQGHEVSLLCGGWPGCPPHAVLDGIDVVRVGTRNTFRLVARRGYKEHFSRRSFDVLVEDINKMPLHTPNWGRVPTVAVVPHLFGSTAFQELPVPVATAVWLAERPIPWVYHHTPFEAISESTANDLVERGISRERIRVIYCGIDSETYTPAPAARAESPVFAYLGRLKRYKAVDLVLRGFARAAIPGARLEVAGAGDYRPALERLASSLDLDDRVTFLGRISEAEKLRLLRRAWALVFTSPKEGWGITNLEAAACGTAVIASDSPGIRESVRHGETGYLVRHGDIEALAAKMKRLAENRALVEQLGAQGRRFATSFTWERPASETARHLGEVIAEPRLAGGG